MNAEDDEGEEESADTTAAAAAEPTTPAPAPVKSGGKTRTAETENTASKRNTKDAAPPPDALMSHPPEKDAANEPEQSASTESSDGAAQATQPEPEGPPVVVLPARLLRDKGVEEFANAARAIKAEGIKARFALVGEPDADNPASITQAQIDAWVAEGIIEYWGFRSDMPEVYRSCSLVCLPSYREGLPRVLLEAAACARAADQPRQADAYSPVCPD